MSRKGKRVEAIGYMRTSCATNVGEGKDSEARQRRAIEGYAKSAGFVIVEWFYDKTLEKHERLVRYVDITKSVRAKFTRTQSSYIAAQKSLDLWKDPTGGETASVRQLASLD